LHQHKTILNTSIKCTCEIGCERRNRTPKLSRQSSISYRFFSCMDHYALCLSYHSNTEWSFAVFCQAEPPRLVDYAWPQYGITRRTTASGVESRFRNLSITSPALFQLNCAVAAMLHPQVSFIFYFIFFN